MTDFELETWALSHEHGAMLGPVAIAVRRIMDANASLRRNNEELRKKLAKAESGRNAEGEHD